MITFDGEEDGSICIGVKTYKGQFPITYGSGERPKSGRSHHWVDQFSEGTNGRSDRESWVVARVRRVCAAKRQCRRRRQ
jgi:hypothetical protein